MEEKKGLKYFLRNLRQKHRLSMRDVHGQREVWYMHVSPFELFGGAVALILVIFIVVLTLAAYTPVLNFIPGYEGNRTREELISNIMRVDSIQKRLDEIELYTNDISVILDGKTPFTRNVEQGNDTTGYSRSSQVPPSSLDSTLRAQMEGSGIYSLSNPSARRNVRSGFELITPVRGVVATHFNPKENRYGVGIATAADQQVLAVDEGTVTLTSWSPEEGYIIQIQHADNLISIYKRSTGALVPLGSRVRPGEVIGSTGEGLSGEEGKGLFEMELWHNGSPVDPENYIVF